MQKNKLYWPTYKKAERTDPRHEEIVTSEQEKMHNTCKTHLTSKCWIRCHTCEGWQQYHVKGMRRESHSSVRD